MNGETDPEAQISGAADVPPQPENSPSGEPPQPDSHNAETVAREPSKGRSEAKAKTIVGSGVVNDSILNITNNLTLGGGARSASGARRLSLTRVDKLPKGFKPFHDEALVAKYACSLQAGSVLVVEHTSQGYEAAESAIFSTLAWLETHTKLSKRYTNEKDGDFSLLFFKDDDTWMEECSGSVIYLYRSLAATVSDDIYDHATVDTLRRQLTEAQCRLIVITRRPVRVHASQHTRADVEVWTVGPPDTTSSGALLPGTTDATSLLIRACVALFPGLSPLELANVIDRLLPERPPVKAVTPPVAPTASGQSADSPAPTPASPPEPTALERWHDGDRDSLLGEQGLRHRAPPDVTLDDDESGNHGYFFENAEISAAVLESLYASSPLLLVQQLPALTDIYFSANASQRYQKGFLRYLVSLHKQQLYRLEAPWLSQLFHASIGSNSPWHGLERIESMMTHMVRNLTDGRELAAALIHELGSYARDLEDAWHKLLLHNDFPQAYAAPHQSTDQVLRAINLEQPYSDTCKALFLLQSFLVYTCSEMLTVASEAIIAALTGAANRLRLHSFSANEDVLHIILPAAILLRVIMTHTARANPEIAIAFSAAAVEQLGDDTFNNIVGENPADLLFGGTEQRAAAAHLLLIETCQEGFSCLLPNDLESVRRSFFAGACNEPLSEQAYAALFLNGQGRRTGEILGKLYIHWSRGARAFTAGAAASNAPTVVVDELITFYGTLCAALLMRKGATAAAVSTDMVSFVAPLRAELRAAQRAELVQHTREVYKQLEERRNQQQRRGSRKDADETAQWVRALRVVSYALSQNSPRVTTS